MYTKVRLILIVCLVLQGVKGFPQEEMVPSPSQTLTEFSFKTLVGGVVILQATLIPFPDTLNFILDTGSGGISLDSTTAKSLGLSPVRSDVRIRGVAGIRKVNFLYNKSLGFPDLQVDSLNFHINDYTFLSRVYGVKVDGIIGYSLLSRYIVKLNYDDSLMQICSPGTIRYPKGGFLLKPNIKGLVVQRAKLKDRREVSTRFLHDIGAGVCLMLSKEFVADSTVLAWNRKLWPKEGHGLGGKLQMDLTVIKELRFGPYKFKHVPTLIFDDVYNVTSYPYLGGLIGNDIFRRFNIIYNYPEGDIYLRPNNSFRDRFDYAYSGIDLQLINGKVEIGGVAKDSPADIAGVKIGDIVLGMNGDFSLDFFKYKKLLQRPKREITLLVRRGVELKILKFKIKNIRQVFR